MKRFVLLALLIFAAGLAAISQNPRNVLVYNLTDTDCGPCSCMDSIIRGSILPAYPKTIIVALHSPMMNSGFRKYQGNEVYKFFNPQYEPSGFIDGLGYDVPYVNLTTAVGQRFTDNPEAPVKINVNSKTWDPATRNVNLSLNITNLGAEIPGACWCNIFVTEDNLIHRHRVWGGCATPDQPVPPFKEQFINDHVIRKLEYFARGDSLIGPTWQAQQTITRSFNVHIDTGWVEGNCSLVFAVYKKNDSLYKAAIQQAIKQSVTGGVGVEEKKISDDGIRLVYPNHTTDWVNIHIAVSGAGNCNLRIIDVTGKTIDTLLDQWMESGAYNVEYNTRDLPAGNYFLFLRSPSGESIRGIVVRL